MNNKKSHVLNIFMNRKQPSIVKGDGIYLIDDRGNRILDGAAGVLMCNLGHGVDQLAKTIYEQAKKISYAYRLDFSTPPLEEAAAKVCEATRFAVDKVFFVSGGSEANEIAVKLVRKYHIDNGKPSKYKIISRWLSYHGMTTGALAWSGMSGRRADYIPMMPDSNHIPPAYCYRCWFNLKPESCNLECAQALEREILCLGPETVAAFIAEPISGTSLCGAMPRLDYFKKIREICDRYDVLLILDEILNGFGRCGKWFGYEYYGIEPDILTMGKGMGAGYFPVGAAAVTARVAETIAQKSGVFGAGFSWAGNPISCAVVSRTIDYMKEHRLIAKSSESGEYLAQRLEPLRAHPTVGDVRGIGLMRGLEFVKDKNTKKSLDPAIQFSVKLSRETLKHGLCIQFSGGNELGQAGDMIFIGPPFIITKDQIDDLVSILDESLTAVEKKYL